MRTGAIFARGSCRALRWMALVGGVFALGAGSALAQVTITGPADDTVLEGRTAEYSVEVEGFIAAGASAATVTVTLATPTPNTDDAALTGESGDISGNSVLTYTVAVPPAATGATASAFFSATGTIEVRTTEDDEAEDDRFDLAFTLTSPGGLGIAADDTTAISLPTAGTAGNPNTLTIEDGDPQNYVLTVTTTAPKEGMPIEATVKADPPHEDGSSAVTLEISDDMGGSLTDYSLTVEAAGTNDGTSVNGNIVTIGSGTSGSNTATEATVMITPPSNDMNRDPDPIVLTASTTTGGVREVKSTRSISVADIHALPAGDKITVTAYDMETDGDMTTSVAAGGMVYLEVTVDRGDDGYPMDEPLTVELSLSDSSLARLAMDEVTVPGGSGVQEATAQVELTAEASNRITPGMLMVNLLAKGENDDDNGPSGDGVMGTPLSLEVTQPGTPMITAKSQGDVDSAISDAMAGGAGDNGLNPDESFDIDPNELFMLSPAATTAGYTLELYDATSDNAAVEAGKVGGMVRVNAKAVGEAMVTVTARASMPSSATIVDQARLDEAMITFDVMVVAVPAVDPVAPGAPTGLTPTAGDKQVALAWKAPTSGDAPTGYHVRYGPGDFWSDWADTDSMAAHTVTGLDNGTEYTFEVRATNAAGNGPAASVKATPMGPDPGPQVVVKEVKVNTSVPESGGLEVTVVATVPAGTKVDGKVAPIASKAVMVDPHVFSGEGIGTNEEAEPEDVRVLTSPTVWKNITRTDKDSEQTYKFRLAIGQDLDAEDEKFRVSVSIDGAAKMSPVITIDDAQEQSYDLSLPSAAKGAIKEGSSGTITLKAVPAKTFDIPVTLALNPNDPSKYTLSSPSSNMFGVESVTASVSAKADGDRSDDTVTVSAYTTGTLGNDVKIAELDITITDVNALPAVKATLVDDKGKALDPQPESVMEGDTVKVMLTVVDKDGKAMKAAEKLTVSLMATGTADGQDYRLSTHPIEIASGKESSAAVDLMVVADQDVGEETLVFDAAVGGESKIGSEKRSVAGVLSLMITDGTRKLVWAKTQEEVEAAVYAAKNAGAGEDMTFTPGEMIELMGSALFSSDEGVTLSYSAMSDHDHVATTSVSGGMVTVTAGDETGMAHITITAHASMPSGVKILDQTDPGEASVMFPVEVGLEALSITLMGPEDMNLVEGMSVEVTATANRAVTDDTKVMLMRARAMSSASDEDYTAEPITIMAGEMTGSTMVMAVEDNMMETVDNMPEELVLYGMTEGMAGEVTGEVKLYLWDAAVPALPVIAQLLLAAFLAVGGYRRYLRR